MRLEVRDWWLVRELRKERLMFFILLTFLAAFLIEGLGTLVSVIGLSTLFGSNPIIIALAVSLDIGKLVVVSMLYKYWKQMGTVMKSYALAASIITMVITSAGAAGYLSGEFQKAIMGTQEVGLKVNVLKEQQAKYEERKKQIDQQIAALPEKTSVNQRIRLINAFKAEQADLQRKINEIDQQLPELQIKQIGVEAKAGPILYIAKAFNISVEEAVKWVILMIIFVFDPLAVFLIVAGNFLMEQRKKPKEEPKEETLEKMLEQYDPAVHNHGELFQEYQPDPEEEKFYAKRAELAKQPVVTMVDDIDEPGFGNSAVRFDEQIKAMPEELRRPIFEVLEPTPQVTPIAPEPEEAELTTEEEQEPQVSPVVAEPTPQPQRPQITLDDLRPVPRSSLHDVRGDASVVFDQNPRSAQHGDFYSNQS